MATQLLPHGKEHSSLPQFSAHVYCSQTVAHLSSCSKSYASQNRYPFNSIFSSTTCISWHQTRQTHLDFNEARDGVALASAGPSASHLHQCTSRQTDNHASTSPLNFYLGQMPFQTSCQQCQSTESNPCLPRISIKNLSTLLLISQCVDDATCR